MHVQVIKYERKMGTFKINFFDDGEEVLQSI